MKTALVTGASRGIGNAIALELKQKGYSVIGTATSQTGVDSLLEKGIEAYILDLNSKDSIDQFWSLLEENNKSISVLINNAGITRDNIVLRMSDEEWSDIMNVHLYGTFQLCKRSLKMMLKNKWGRIINMASMSVKEPLSYLALSNSIRSAVTTWGKTLSNDLGVYNITVNNILTGYFDTERINCLLYTSPSPRD